MVILIVYVYMCENECIHFFAKQEKTTARPLVYSTQQCECSLLHVDCLQLKLLSTFICDHVAKKRLVSIPLFPYTHGFGNSCTQQ